MRRFEEWLAGMDTGIAVKEFPAGTRTAVDAARAVGCEVGQIVKSLVFVAGGRPVVALVSGANRLDERRLAAVAGAPVLKTSRCSWTATCSAMRWSGPPPAGLTPCSRSRRIAYWT
jgi:prolyl-tRNA editing enzyme YbaK/EbsC (Cys-tRNA(Pro) deacylase)